MRFARSCFLILLLHVVASAQAGANERQRRILFVGQSKGYQHESIATAMVMFYNLGKKSGEWETEFRTDCMNITKKPLPWEAKNLDDFDAVAFFTDGNLDLDDSQKADLLGFVREDGKGFIGIHSAAVTNASWPEYREMLGGFFDGHPWGQVDAPLVVADGDFPGMKHLAPRFTMRDEIYQIKDFERDNVRVLLKLDRERIDLAQPGVHAEGNDFPLMWVRDYGKGRVLYNSLGHRHEVWERADMQAMWLDQIRWLLRLAPDNGGR